MKKRTTLCLLMLFPLLASCKPRELVIPNVDVLSMQLDLPARPTYNVGNISKYGSYDVIDIYELSDFHGAVNYKENENIGLAKLATFLDQKRAENPGGTVVVSSGDMFQGSCESNLTRGYMVNYAMNYMGFDAMSVGNHEFDWTETWLKNNAELSYNGHVTPMLGANIAYKSNNLRPTYLQGSTIIERGQYKIGIVGSIGEGLTKSILASAIEPFKFTNEVNAVNSEVAQLKQDGCNFVIWNTHNSVSFIQDKVGSINDVDVCFGGHAHIDDIDFTSSPKIIATKNNGGSIAHATLTINPSTKDLVSSYVEHLSLDDINAKGLSENSNVNKIMSQYNSGIDKVKNIKLGKTDGELKKATELCNVCTKAMYTSAVKFFNNNPQYQIDTSKIVAAYHNGAGGVRTNIAAGKIYYSNVYQACPFDNEIVLFEVDGFELFGGKYGSYGIYHPNANIKSINPNEKYYVLANDFIATGENGLNKDEAELTRTGLIIRDEVAKFIYAQKKIKSADYARTVTNFKNFERN